MTESKHQAANRVRKRNAGSSGDAVEDMELISVLPPNVREEIQNMSTNDSSDAVTVRKIMRKCLRRIPLRKRCGMFFGIIISFTLLIFVTIILVYTTKGDLHGIDRDIYFSPRNIPLPRPGDWNVSSTHYLDLLAEAVKYPTISYGDDRDRNLSTRAQFAYFLEEQFPHINSSSDVTREIIGGASLLYEIKGLDKSLKPYLLIAHMDVVPVENVERWEKNPFGGEIDDEYIHGRGTLDVKSAVIGLLGAIETMLSENSNWRPKRSILVFIGHDEETGGFKGAKIAAETLEKRGVQLEFILDEGAAATLNYFPGIDRTICLIGVAEKGFLSVELEATADGGHSSMPSDQNAIGSLAAAITALRDNPLPYHFESDDINRKSFEWIAPYFNFGLRLVTSNMWLFRYSVLAKVTDTPETKALARTTTAFTVISGGIKDNVLPKYARALVNHRLHPGDKVEKVLSWDRDVIAGIQGVTLKAKPGWRNEPSPISPHGKDAAAYHVVKSSIHSVIPDALVIPYLTVGGTDSKHFLNLTRKIYRFVPYVLDKKLDDAKRIHGDNERMRREIFHILSNFICLSSNWRTAFDACHIKTSLDL